MSANPADPLVQAGPGATHSFNENAEVIAILGHSKSLPTITSPTVVSTVHKLILTLYLIETSLTEKTKISSCKSCLIRVYFVYLWKYDQI